MFVWTLASRVWAVVLTWGLIWSNWGSVCDVASKTGANGSVRLLESQVEALGNVVSNIDVVGSVCEPESNTRGVWMSFGCFRTAKGSVCVLELKARLLESKARLVFCFRGLPCLESLLLDDSRYRIRG